MTHLFSATENEMAQLQSETKRFDILKFTRGVSVGDTIIYQLVREPLEEGEGHRAADGALPEELSFKVDFIFPDMESALKKGFVAVQFKQEI